MSDEYYLSPEVVGALNEITHLISQVHFALYDAHRLLAKISVADDRYADLRTGFDEAVLLLAKAKWFAGRASGSHLYIAPFTGSIDDCSTAREYVLKAQQMVEAVIEAAGENGDTKGLVAEGVISTVSTVNEIQFAGEVPLVPTACPIIMLIGSSREMGRQYVHQVVQIFGAWMFEQIGRRHFSSENIAVIMEWERQLQAYAPEICEYAQGWVDGARELGLSLSYVQAIQLWTGHYEPYKHGLLRHGVRDLAGSLSAVEATRASTAYLGGQGIIPDSSVDDLAVDLCSGCVAWGEATVDGHMVAGATTDHECTFQATIIAYPDDGIPFIYTPFSVTGFIPQLGQYYFAGHPGMNARGLAYVHHGGGLHALEPESERGYGLRRGASTFHNLRYAASAEEALRNELSWPVGDSGTILGSVGGFYADGSSAYICEARPGAPHPEKPLLRWTSVGEDGRAFTFLYANNNSVHPEGFKPILRDMPSYAFNAVDGWVCDIPDRIPRNIDPMVLSSALSTKTSQGRNRYLFNALESRYGRIDRDAMQLIFSTGAPERYGLDQTPLSHAEREAEWSSGAPWPSSISHRLNAFTAVMKPADDGTGTYLGCIGPGSHDVLMHTPGHGYYYFQELNEFWEVTLTDEPENMAMLALDLASSIVRESVTMFEERSALLSPSSRTLIGTLIVQAKDAVEESRAIMEQVAEKGAVAPDSLSRSLRRSTVAQVRGRKALTLMSDVPAAMPQLLDGPRS
ncbi:MAG: hypothetical protein EP321_00365 [Sphingomonadales bacterium]|nr:MAG: hypothetical protein EP321_00365 [Sphingomonadales bacterium]